MPKLNVIEVAAGETGVQAAMAAVHQLFEADESFGLVVAGDQFGRSALAADLPTWSTEPCAVLTTSGSTGQPRAVELTVSALAAAAEQSAVHFRDQAVWLTCLPVTGIGGLNTLLRSALAGTAPIVWPGVAGAETFTADAITPYLKATLRSAQKQRLAAAASLVPTQLFRIAESGPALAALAELDYVLVGGGRTPRDLLDTARAAGVNLVTTYGATETCGGVVYNGVPLPEVQIATAANGELTIAGPMLGSFYRDGTAITQPWRTGDLGELRDGRVAVTGRLDEQVKVAGHKLNLRALSGALEELRGIGQLAVAAAEDAEYGQVPVIAFTGELAVAEVEAAYRDFCGSRLPVRVRSVAALPMLPNGKPDRQQISAL